MCLPVWREIKLEKQPIQRPLGKIFSVDLVNCFDYLLLPEQVLDELRNKGPSPTAPIETFAGTRATSANAGDMSRPGGPGWVRSFPEKSCGPRTPAFYFQEWQRVPVNGLRVRAMTAYTVRVANLISLTTSGGFLPHPNTTLKTPSLKVGPHVVCTYGEVCRHEHTYNYSL